MTTQGSPDHLLSRLRFRVKNARVVDCNVSMHPDQVIALVECAEAGMHVAAKRRCRVGGGSNLTDRQALDSLDAALDKLEAL